MTVNEIVGSYQISGTNQEENISIGYNGILTLTLDDNQRVVANWLIGQTQLQSGKGFFKDDILVIHFQYIGDSQSVFKGIVVYRCLSPNLLEGFWSEKYGDPRYLGSEQAIKIGGASI